MTQDKRDNPFLATEGYLIAGVVRAGAGLVRISAGGDRPAEVLHALSAARPVGPARADLSAHAGSPATTRRSTTASTPAVFRRSAASSSAARRRASTALRRHDVFFGGDFQLLASAEYMFPITADDMLRGVVFCDTGTVEPTISNWTNRYRVAPGFGLRICVPAMGPAPIALDFAFPVAWQPGDRSEFFSFFVGFGR